MKNYLLLAITLILSTQFVFGQSCLPDGITFSTQQQIDDFAINFPGCTMIGGEVTIHESSPSNIVNLHGLENLEYIGGDFDIIKTTLTDLVGLDSLKEIAGDFYLDVGDSLTSLTGLQNLTTIGGYLSVGHSYPLQNYVGLESLKTIGGELDLVNNSTVKSFSGLNNLTSIGESLVLINTTLTSFAGLDSLTSIGEEIYLSKNDSLLGLSGLDNLKTIGAELYIIDNSSLTSLTGLNKLSSVGDYVYLGSNSSLTSLSGLENLKTIEDDLQLVNNASLLDLNGLDNLTFLGGDLYLFNTSFTSLDGLSKLTAIGGSIRLRMDTSLIDFTGLETITSLGAALLISDNSALSSLDGLDNVTSINGTVYLNNNSSLQSLTGIQNINPTTIESQFSNTQDLEIWGNPKLSTCEVQSICDLLDLPDKTKNIHDNMIGCNSETEIQNACNLPSSCSSLTNPLNGSNNVNITSNLNWESVPDALGYKLTLGTAQGGNDLYDNEDVGNTTTFDPEDFPCATTIYATITPYNSFGDLSSCTEESFTTEEIIATTSDDVSICQGTSTQLIASGGAVYSWSPIEGLDDPNISNPNANPEASTTYTVTVSSGNGCEDTDEVIVTVNENPAPNASASDETFNDANDGTATCDPSGGATTYSFLWNTDETTQSIDNLAPGNYTISVTDANNCSSSQTVIVNEFVCPDMEIESSAIDASCFQTCDGSITATPSMGIPPYSYSWSNDSTMAINNDLCAGEYTLTITDSKNCTIEEVYTITEPEEIIVTIDEVVHVMNGILGSISINTNGDYNYQWTGPNSFSSSNEDINNLEVGCYTVQVINQSTECSIDTTICIDDLTSTNNWTEANINVYPNPVNSLLTIEFGQSFPDGKLSIMDFGGKPIHQFTKTGLDTKEFLNTQSINSGIYLLKVEINEKTLYKRVIITH